MADDEIDFVLAAWQEEGRWRVESLPQRTGESITSFVESLAAQPSDGGVLGMLSVSEEFFVLARVHGQSRRFLLSDVTAAADWSVASEALDLLGIDWIDDEEGDAIVPAGDLAIVADWGMPEADVSMLSEDIDLYPDEVLGAIATKLGFGEQFEIALDNASG